MKQLCKSKIFFLLLCFAVAKTLWANDAYAQAGSCNINSVSANSQNIFLTVTATINPGQAASSVLPLSIILNDEVGNYLNSVTANNTSSCNQSSCNFSFTLPLSAFGISASAENQRFQIALRTRDNLYDCVSNFSVQSENTADEALEALDGPSSADFDNLNPLRAFGNPTIATNLSTPAGLISRLLLFAFPIAGILMLLMLVWGGFEILSGATNKKSLDSGKNRIKAAIAGFMLLFTSYWIVQVIEVVLGIQIF